MSNENRPHTEEEIDDIVTAHADTESAWEEPIRVRKSSNRFNTGMPPDDELISHLPISCDPDTLSGVAVFRGTRVTVASLLDNLAAGLTLDEFLNNFPTVTREQALQVLEFFKDTIARARS